MHTYVSCRDSITIVGSVRIERTPHGLKGQPLPLRITNPIQQTIGGLQARSSRSWESNPFFVLTKDASHHFDLIDVPQDALACRGSSSLT